MDNIWKMRYVINTWFFFQITEWLQDLLKKKICIYLPNE